VRHARIDAYRGFGSADRALVSARVLRGEPLRAAALDDSVWENLGAMLRRFESDEVAGARVRVRFPGGALEVQGDEEGYVQAWIDPRPPFPGTSLWHEVELDLLHPAPDAAPRPAVARVMVPPAEAAFGVISDIDDTVVRTDATDLLRMLRNVFLANAHTRVPFPGVAAFYRALQRGTAGRDVNPIFYVSSSPWNLHDVLAEFLALRRIPEGPLLLRDWGISRTEVLPVGHGAHKHAQIRRIMDLFPALPFILVGDSGQEDPEIYGRVVQDHPDRILAVYIRNVTPLPERVGAIRRLAAEVEAAGSTLLLTDDTLAAARHAAEKGWIDDAAVAEVESEARTDVPMEKTEPGTAAANEALSTETPPST
jgi:phosphatidate phosphatase APP1